MIQRIESKINVAKEFVSTQRNILTPIAIGLGGSILGTAFIFGIRELSNDIDARLFKEGREVAAKAAQDAADQRWAIVVNNFQKSKGVNLTYGRGNVVRVDLNDSIEAAPSNYDPYLAAADRIHDETQQNVIMPGNVPERASKVYMSTIPNP